MDNSKTEWDDAEIFVEVLNESCTVTATVKVGTRGTGAEVTVSATKPTCAAALTAVKDTIQQVRDWMKS